MKFHEIAKRLSSLAPPFVHSAKGPLPAAFVPKLKQALPDVRIMELQDQEISDHGELTDACRERLGVHISHTPPREIELFWMRFDDIIRTDIDFRRRSGGLILVHQAGRLLRSSPDGLIRFSNDMANAGAAYADPDDLGLHPPHRPRPESLHTLLIYDDPPRRAPAAAPIKLNG
jgi:hypothetical protein